MTVGFSFDYNGTNQAFAPAPVARNGSDNAGDCLAAYAQVEDGAWFLGGSASLTSVGAATTFQACVDACSADDSCQYVTFDYDANTCQKKVDGSGT